MLCAAHSNPAGRGARKIIVLKAIRDRAAGYSGFLPLSVMKR